jgi:hypothetical protein
MPELTPTFGWLDIPNPHGDKLFLTGRILSRSAAPLAGVVIEFFQADPAGKYHLADYQLRDRQRTTSDGSFMLETFLPGHAGTLRRINYLATARIPGRSQPLFLAAAIHFATEEELSRSVSDADRAYVRPGAVFYHDDPAYLRLEDVPVRDGTRRVEYNIVFDVA